MREVNNGLCHIMSQTEKGATFPSWGFDLFKTGGTRDESDGVCKKLVLNSGVVFFESLLEIAIKH